MLFKKYPIIITKDSDDNYHAVCVDLNYGCVVHGMTLPEACGAAMCAIHQLCDSMLEQGIPLPEATPVEIATESAPEDTLLITTVIVARREADDPQN